MSGLGTAMAGGKPAKQGARHGAPTAQEFYPTPAVVTEALLDFWRPVSSWVWEPACGDGAMAEVLKAQGLHVVCSDIVDRGYPGTLVTDFLTLISPPTARGPALALVTNPPFSVAEKFIRHALEVLAIREMAILVKATFWNAGGRVKLFEEHPPRYVLPLAFRADFLGKGSPVMDVTWCVWQGPSRDTITRPLRRPAKVAKP